MGSEMCIRDSGKVVGINEKKVSVQFVDGTKDIALILAGKFLKK